LGTHLDPGVVAAATGRATSTGRRTAWWLALGTIVLVGALALGVTIGPAGRISSANWNIVWTIRMPRVALAALVGAMLSLAGASYQGVFRNPLVDPYLLGVAAGAGLGATIVFAWGSPWRSRMSPVRRSVRCATTSRSCSPASPSPRWRRRSRRSSSSATTT